MTFLLTGFLIATSFFFFSGAEDFVGALPVPVGLVFLVTLGAIDLHQYNHVLEKEVRMRSRRNGCQKYNVVLFLNFIITNFKIYL